MHLNLKNELQEGPGIMGRKCIAVLHTARIRLSHGLAWLGLGWTASSQGFLLLTFICFPLSAFPLLQAPGQKRRQSPHLASQQWPRQGWHSSRTAVGPPSATSCSPYVGAPELWEPSLPLSCPHSPHFTGVQELSKAEGIDSKPMTAIGAMGMAGGPSLYSV